MMAVHIPLDACSSSTSPAFPASTTAAGPSFARTSSRPLEDLREVYQSLRAAKRIVVVSGAGISTAASIPDFRSASGLFNGSNEQVARKGKGRARREGSGEHDIKDLFHVRCLSSPTLLAHHQSLITSLASLSFSAEPTPFHQFLAQLDKSSQLLRCYTQNIDGLEEKAGLNMGIPLSRDAGEGRSKGRCKSRVQLPSESSGDSRSVPRVIPLHGLLTNLHCPLCHSSFPLGPYLPLPAIPIPCPTCELSQAIRSALSERSRRTGTLRASVVLYGEEHPQGEAIGAVVERDLRCGTRRRGKAGGVQGQRWDEGAVDFLLVAGTSLSVPGVKRIVKEFAKSVKASRANTTDGTVEKDGQRAATRTVIVNHDPPSKAEWDGVFDVWVQGDVQTFVKDYLDNPVFHPTPDTTEATQAEVRSAVIPSTPKKRKSTKRSISTDGTIYPPTPMSLEKTTTTKQTKGNSDSYSALSSSSYHQGTPIKKRGKGTESAIFPPSPETTPRPRPRPAKRCKIDNDGGGEDKKVGVRERSNSLSPAPSLMVGRRCRLDLEASLTPLSDME